MVDVFISYASENRSAAARLAGALKGSGFAVWWDRELVAGERFDQVIEQELMGAGCVVVLWSKAAVASVWVRSEAAAAVSRDVFVPAQIEVERLPLAFSLYQTLDLTGWNGYANEVPYVELLRAVNGKLRKARGQHMTKASRSVEVIGSTETNVPPRQWRASLLEQTRWVRTVRVSSGTVSHVIKYKVRPSEEVVLVDGLRVAGKKGIFAGGRFNFRLVTSTGDIDASITLAHHVATMKIERFRIVLDGQVVYVEGGSVSRSGDPASRATSPALSAALDPYRGIAQFHVDPEIPDHLRRSAQQWTGIPESEHLLLVVTLPLLERSAKRCLALTDRALYFLRADRKPEIVFERCPLVELAALRKPPEPYTGLFGSSVRLDKDRLIDLDGIYTSATLVGDLLEQIRRNLSAGRA
jgi:hypothetical protein